MAIKHHETPRGLLAYDKRGLGDPLLLVHGIYAGASHHEFRHNIDALSKHFTVYALDLLGFGDSDMPRMTYTAQFYQHLLRDFIVEVIGGPTHIIASGVSCGPAAALAVYNDELVGKLVLIDPQSDSTRDEQSPNIGDRIQQFVLGTLAMGHGLYDTLSSEFEIQRFVLSRYAHPKRAHLEQIPEMRQRATRRHAMHAFLSQMTGHLAMDVPRWLRYVRREVLIIRGSYAGPFPVERFLQPAAWSKGKRIEMIEDAAHWPHDEQSAKVNDLVVHFLNDQNETHAG